MADEMQEPIVLQVEEFDECRDRLDHYLVKKLPEFSRSRLQALIREGQVLVNGQGVKAKVTVEAGDCIEISLPPPVPCEVEPEEITLSVLFEDEHLIAVDKPEGMVVHPGAGHWRGTLVSALLHHCRGQLSGIGGVDRPGIVHRLDKDTSGCIVAAKNDAAHRALSAAFFERRVSKTYRCVVVGEVKEPAGRIENFIGRNPRNRQKMAVVSEERRGKLAITEWTKIGSGSDCTSVSCDIHTGRTHQIRVHMAYTLGHAILGDPIYGKGTLKRAESSRLMLHAWRLAFEHPVTGRAIKLEAPLPAEFQEFPGFSGC